jgi:diadenosine tetraphosphate (Ap4A) HIT family hydrolase
LPNWGQLHHRMRLNQLGKKLDCKLLCHGHFNVDHCCDVIVPGYLIVSPVTPVTALAALSKRAQQDLGPVLSAVTAAITVVIAPMKIYCVLFGEEHQQVHFHIFPRRRHRVTWDVRRSWSGVRGRHRR